MTTSVPPPASPSPTDAILLVNDREDQLLSLAATLEPLGVETVSVNSGPEALRQLLRREFSVMLLDVHMPGMDGFEIAETIRSRPRMTPTPIIFVSASHQDELDRLRGYETGAFDYVMTPVNPQILRAKVAAFLKMHRMHREISQQAEHLARLNAQLVEKNAALEALQQSKDLLTGMVVHDLRNPLTACLGNIEVASEHLRRAGVTLPKQLPAATQATLNLLEMINRIVDITRMEDAKMPVARQEVDIDALATRCVELYRGAATTQGIELAYRSHPSAGVFSTDSSLLGRVIDNLVVNALKHTPRGGRVAITVQRTPDQGLLLTISDTGEGIPAESLGRLFQKYGRAEGQKLGRTYDTGLGLVFCRMAVELLHGSITVTSEPGRGTTFTMTFAAG